MDHVLRVHVRVDFGGDVEEIRAGTDMCLPAASSLSEVLPDILSLVDAPNITVPWEGFTGSGRPIDPAAPLHTQGVVQGGIIMLAPKRPSPARIAKDAAEALSDLAQTSTPAKNTLDLATVAGFVGLGVVLLLSPLPVSNSWRFALLALAAVAVLSWRRNSSLLVVTAVATAISTAWVVMAPQEGIVQALRNSLEPTDGGLALLSAGAAVVTITSLVQLIKKHHLIVFSACITAGLLIILAAPGVWIFTPGFNIPRYGWAFSFAGLAIALGMLTVAFSASIASACAGLRVPRLPSAGQDLAISDDVPADPDAQAARATRILDGILIGVTVILAPSLTLIALNGGGFAQALCLTVAISLLVHAHRHHRKAACWAMWCGGLIAAVMTAVAADTSSPIALIISAVACVTLASAPLWSHKISQLEPTTIVWIERVESLCIAASLPLALHLAGLFILIRGLG